MNPILQNRKRRVSRELWIWILLLILIKFVGLIYLQSIEFNFFTSDVRDYLSTAKNLSSGEGFISHEFNPKSQREYLGENYCFVGDPMYPLYLAPFFYTGLDTFIIIQISGLILYIVLLMLTMRLAIFFKLNYNSRILILTFIVFCPHIHLLSLTATALLIRIIAFMALFYWTMYGVRNHLMENTWYLSVLAIIGGFAILTRMTYVLIPLLIIPIIYIHSSKKIRNVLLYVGVIAIVISPWIYRNYHDFGIITVDVRLNEPKYEDPRYELATAWRITDNRKYWRFVAEENPEIKEKMLSEIEVGALSFIRLYLLRLKEIFKPFPTGPPFNKIWLQVYSLVFFVPWITGIVLFFLRRIKELNHVWLYWSLGLLSFIILHILRNSPHSRYMIPMAPLGILFLLLYFKERRS